jgi:hypothetical protein
MENIDYTLLKKQKEILIKLANDTNRLTQDEIDTIDGIINLLDAIQDKHELSN